MSVKEKLIDIFPDYGAEIKNTLFAKNIKSKVQIGLLDKLVKNEELIEETKHLIERAKMNISVEKLRANLSGSQVEESVFNQLGAALRKLNTKDTMVFNGWNVKAAVNCEFDFFIASEPLRAIFQIEVKRKYTQKVKEKALQQLEKGFKLFLSKIPFRNKDNWKYVKVMYFDQNEENNEFHSQDVGYCYNCQSHILGPYTNFEVWWEQMTENLANKDNVCQQNEDDQSQSRTIYLQIIQYLFCQLYLQSEKITKQDILNKTLQNIKSTSTPEKLFFWSRIQFSLLTDVTKTRVAFISEYGTGKTILLKEKAKQLLKQDDEENTKKKVIFIFIKDTVKETKLQHLYKQDLQDANVKFHDITTMGNSF